MKHEINLNKAEEAVLEVQFLQHAENLSSCWNVQSFDDFIHLLVMHGSDCIESIPRLDVRGV